jgi:hypothetical protein
MDSRHSSVHAAKHVPTPPSDVLHAPLAQAAPLEQAAPVPPGAVQVPTRAPLEEGWQ